MSSAEVVCCKYVPNITDKLSIEAISSKQRGPRTDCSYRSRTILRDYQQQIIFSGTFWESKANRL